MNPTKPKARKPFKQEVPVRGVAWTSNRADWINCLCVPLDAASVEALRKRAYHAIIELPAGVAFSAQHEADAVLAALGIKRRKSK
jgi:hypothetical protein